MSQNPTNKDPANTDPANTGTDIVTFGCRLNAYESEVMKTHAEAAGLDNTVIFNTCAVTGEATRQARQAIRRTHRDRPDAKIIVTGCAAQIDPDLFRSIDGVTAVMGNEEKLHAQSFKALSDGALERVTVNDIFSVKETAGQLISGFGTRARAFVQVQNGCNHRCTFCIIPYGRGNSRSTGIGEVVNQIRDLVAQGYSEVVLTGVDITSFGEDLPGAPTLGELVQKILKLVPELPRLRLSSIDSIEVDKPLLDAIADEPRFMPHLHLSLQAGDNMILKRMKRRHLREDAIAFTQQAKALRPDMVFGADIIAGFPTETEAMFQQSLDLVDACDLTYLHVFPYSEREDTPAARMPQVAGDIRRERAARLRAAGARKLDSLMQRRTGGQASVLVEKRDDQGRAIGHSEDFLPVAVANTDATAGTILPAILTARDGEVMRAQPRDDLND